MYHSKIIHVVVGIIKNSEGKVLLCKSNNSTSQNLLWGFPKGEVKSGEDVLEALNRELKEDINITLHSANPFMVVKHHDGYDKVMLDFRISDDFSGEVYGNDKQRLEWVSPERLGHYEFAQASRDIVKALQR